MKTKSAAKAGAAKKKAPANAKKTPKAPPKVVKPRGGAVQAPAAKVKAPAAAKPKLAPPRGGGRGARAVVPVEAPKPGLLRPNRRGRPSSYTEEIAAKILARLSTGKTLRKICSAEGYPHESTVRGWVVDDVAGFSTRYARARELQREAWADEIVEIADEASDDYVIDYSSGKAKVKANGSAFSRASIQIETRKWLLARLGADKYGNSIKLGGSVGLHESWLDKMENA